MSDAGGTLSRARSDDDEAGAPPEPHHRLFLRFLKFGALAWGGPAAQIAMIRQELVEEDGWISRRRFNRVLALYQVLPGPEAHELCVYFGTLARGRLGGVLSGLAFMLPGFILMLALSALYAAGLQATGFRPFFLGVQPAVVALILRAVHRIGTHAVTNGWLAAVAVAGAVAQLASVPFWVTLTLSGTAYVLSVNRRNLLPAIALAALFAVAGAFLITARTSPDALIIPAETLDATARPSPFRLFWSGLRAGLLTFGGAYTVLPFLQRDAVQIGQWMTNAEFLDGVALSGILPAPFIIFATFVGYVGGGPPGAVALTLGVFLPAFAFTLVAHQQLERAVQHPTIHAFLDGVTAGVVGLIAATAFVFIGTSVRTVPALVIMVIALVALYAWKAKAAVAGVVIGAGAAGLLLFR